MHSETAEKISRLARSLKELHLAASMEEAYARAKEIILGAEEAGEKSIKDLFEEVEMKEKKTNVKEHSEENKESEEIKAIEEESEQLAALEDELEQIKEELEKDKKKHEQEKDIKKELDKEFKEEEENLDLADENVTVAEEAQKEK